MELFDRDFVVSKIRIAIFVPPNSAKRTHNNRPGHGFAFSVNSCTTYHFSTGKVLTCRPGQCIYLPKGSTYTVDSAVESVPHTNTSDAGTYAINFHLLDDTPQREPFVLTPRGKDKILSIFSRAEAAWRQKSVAYQEECFLALYHLVKLFKSELATYSHLDSILEKLAPALHYIEANYTMENISLPHLARLCGISESYLRKLFHSAFSISPAVYIRNMRLNYAKELLRTGEYSVTTAALMSGFNNATYFAREVKKVTGISPNKYCP